MTLRLHMHPLASYCQKVLIALYENATPFEPVLVDLGDEASRDAFYALAPLGKMPALEDTARGQVVWESSIVIEYLAQNYPGVHELVPADPAVALWVRAQDRFYDIYVHTPMQEIVADRLRPAGVKDPHGVEQNLKALAKAYRLIDADMATKTWAAGESYTMADCAASPALFYAEKLLSFGEHRNLAAYFERLRARPSYQRVLEEAEPYMKFFPG